MAGSRAGPDAVGDRLAPLGAVITHRPIAWAAAPRVDGPVRGAITEAERLAADGATQSARPRQAAGRRQVTGDRSLPHAALDDPEAACEWAGAALDAGD
ncbi:hypothetical protein DLJ49_14770 [Rhodovulum sp. 12E13]|nr:hypothetical protein DLJ49_14770 [Rhodovulum sp. 12E13]